MVRTIGAKNRFKCRIFFLRAQGKMCRDEREFLQKQKNMDRRRIATEHESNKVNMSAKIEMTSIIFIGICAG